MSDKLQWHEILMVGLGVIVFIVLCAAGLYAISSIKLFPQSSDYKPKIDIPAVYHDPDYPVTCWILNGGHNYATISCVANSQLK